MRSAPQEQHSCDAHLFPTMHFSPPGHQIRSMIGCHKKMKLSRPIPPPAFGFGFGSADTVCSTPVSQPESYVERTIHRSLGPLLIFVFLQESLYVCVCVCSHTQLCTCARSCVNVLQESFKEIHLNNGVGTHMHAHIQH